MIYITKIINFIQWKGLDLLFMSSALSDEDKQGIVLICVLIPLCILSWWVCCYRLVPFLHSTGEKGRQRDREKEEKRKALESEQKVEEDKDWGNVAQEETNIEDLSQRYYADLISTQNDSLDYEVLTLFIVLFIVFSILSYFFYKSLREWWECKLYNWKIRKLRRDINKINKR